MNDNRWEIMHGDALGLLPKFAPGTFDSDQSSDPPYASGGAHSRRKTSPLPENIRAWANMRRHPLMGTQKISGLGRAGLPRG